MPMNPGDGQLQPPRMGQRAMMARGMTPPPVAAGMQPPPPQGMPPQGMPPQGMGMNRPPAGTGLQMGLAMAKQLADSLRKSDQLSKCVDYSPATK